MGLHGVVAGGREGDFGAEDLKIVALVEGKFVEGESVEKTAGGPHVDLVRDRLSGVEVAHCGKGQ